VTIAPFRPGSLTRSSSDLFVSMRRDLMDLQRQLVTGQKADSYGGLGFERLTSLDARAKLAALDTYSTVIGQADLRIKLMTQNLGRLDKLGSDTKSDMMLTEFEPLGDGRTFAQKTAEQRLKEAIDLLNVDLAGRSLFAGREVDKQPVESYEHIVDGDGAGLDGLKTVIDERIRAERGTNGLGRLDVARTGTTVTLAQEGAALPFGFKITSVATTGTAISHVEGTAPTPNSQMTVGALPNDGDTVTVTLTDPAGTEHTIRLTARATLVPSEPTGFKIGADATETAENLKNALATALKDKVDTKLLPDATMKTATAFFETPSTLQRVSGAPSFEAATAYSADPDPHIVAWYKGDSGNPDDARGTAPVRIDTTQVVAAGAQANEDGVKNILTQLAVTAVTPFKSDDGKFYEALTDKVFENLSDKPDNPKVSEIVTDLANASATMKAAKDRHDATKNMLLDAVDNVEQASKEETGVAILELQTRLQASYQTTSILSQLSLVNYL
jgi:flagellar hook-associated protein 3 FlgL